MQLSFPPSAPGCHTSLHHSSHRCWRLFGRHPPWRRQLRSGRFQWQTKAPEGHGGSGWKCFDGQMCFFLGCGGFCYLNMLLPIFGGGDFATFKFLKFLWFPSTASKKRNFPQRKKVWESLVFSWKEMTIWEGLCFWCWEFCSTAFCLFQKVQFFPSGPATEGWRNLRFAGSCSWVPWFLFAFRGRKVALFHDTTLVWPG